MPDPPKDTKVPWLKVRKKFAEILRYLRATKPIPGGLLEITPMGFKVPEPVYPEHHAQFKPSVYALNDTSCHLYIRPGCVYGSYWLDPDNDEMIDRLPIYQQWPFHVNAYNQSDGTPITLSNDRINLIWLKLNYGAFPAAQVGGDDFGDPLLPVGHASHDEAIKWAMKAFHTLDVTHATGVTTGASPGPHTHSLDSDEETNLVDDAEIDASATPPRLNPGILTPISEHNQFLTSAIFEVTAHEDGEDWLSETTPGFPAETTVTSYILAGFYVIDQYGFATNSAWFLEGPVWAHKYPRVGAKNSDARDGAGDPPDPLTIGSEGDAGTLRDLIPEWPEDAT